MYSKKDSNLWNLHYQEPLQTKLLLSLLRCFIVDIHGLSKI